MTPVLALRARLIAGTAALFVSTGALSGSWPIVALGTVVFSALITAYLLFFPTAILLRRRKIELAWWVPPGDGAGGALTAGHPFVLRIVLRNHGPRRLRVGDLAVLASSAIETPAGASTRVPPTAEVELALPLLARAAGYHVLHGARLAFVDALGLFEVRAYFPNSIGLKVFPRLSTSRAERALLRPRLGPLQERSGHHPIRRRGLAGELRELREHAPGDPFKFIAWKATARRRRLMVRELEAEMVISYQLLVDIGASMRDGPPGSAKLDYAIETAAALARHAIDGGDRVGLVTWDTRIYGRLEADEGRPHFLRILDRLLETRSVVDEDLTEPTDGEIVAAVARYLLHQEAVDVSLRRAPAPQDPAWAHLATGPHGELYDLSALGRCVAAFLERDEAAAAARRVRSPAGGWTRVHVSDGADAEMTRLRRFCRLRGIELPYRRGVEAGRRARGLAEALGEAARGGGAQLVVILSDLEAVLDDWEVVRRAIARVRRRRHPVVAVAPFGPAFSRPAATEAGRRVARVLELDQRRRLEAAQRKLRGAGVPVIVAGPEDSFALLERRLARLRAVRRGYA